MKIGMSITTKVSVNIPAVQKEAENASRLAMRDIVVLIANHAVHQSPVITGNNRRSIYFGVSGIPHQRASTEGRKPKDTWTDPDESVLEADKVQGAIYSTSGYGGYLETGTGRMRPQPYIKPGVDMYFTNSRFSEEMRKYTE
jgi:hypothetical protein